MKSLEDSSVSQKCFWAVWVAIRCVKPRCFVKQQTICTCTVVHFCSNAGAQRAASLATIRLVH
jgi:hypothetical protein